MAGFVVLLTSIAMFLLDGFHLTDGLETPAKLFLVLAAVGLFGVSVHDALRLMAGIFGGAAAAIQQALPPEATTEDEADAEP